MAKKNGILLSIALEGDGDVKAMLKAVGDVGKQSLQGTERSVADAKSAAERIGVLAEIGHSGFQNEPVARRPTSGF